MFDKYNLISDEEEIEDETIEKEDEQIKVGSKVRVKSSVEEPFYKWGQVNHSSVGVVTKLDDDGEMRINFPYQEDWMGKLDEMELVTNQTGNL